MLSVHSCLSASSGNLTRSSWATCSGLHFFVRSAETTAASFKSLTTRRSRGRACREVAIRWAALQQIPLLAVAVASQLATDRRHRPPELCGDGRERAAIPVQIGDRDPLRQREVPHRRRPGLSSQGLHRGIVQPLAGPVDDRSPVQPARPGTSVHADDPTGLRVGHPLLDQTYELLTLARKNIPPMMPIALFHHVHRIPRSSSALRRSLESTCLEVAPPPPDGNPLLDTTMVEQGAQEMGSRVEQLEQIRRDHEQEGLSIRALAASGMNC